MDSIPSNSNINEIVNQAITNLQQMNDGYNKLLSVVQSSFKSVEGANINSQALDYFKNINDVVSNYINIINSTISTLTKNTVNGDLSKLLGYIEYGKEQADKNGEIPKSKYVIIDSLLQMSQVFTAIDKVIQGIAKEDTGSFIKARLNILIFTKNVDKLIGTISKSLGTISKELTSKEISQLMGEDMSKDIIEYNDILKSDKKYSKEGILTGETQSEVIKKQSKETNKSFGILDVLERFTVLVTSLSSFKSPSLIKTSAELVKTEIELKMVILSLNNLSKLCVEQGLTTKRTESLSDRLENINDIFNNLKGIFENVNTVGNPKYIVLLTLANINIILFERLLKHLITFILQIDDKDLKTLGSKTKSLVSGVTNIKTVIDSLLSVAKDLLLITVLFVPSIISLGIGVLFILNLYVFIQALRLLGSVLDNKDFTNIKLQLLNIRSIILSLVIVQASVIALGLLAPIVLSQSENILLSLLLLSTIVLIVGGLLFLVDKFKLTKGAAPTILSIIAVISGLVLIATELVLLSLVSQLVDWKGLLVGCGLLALAIGIVIGIAALLAMSGGVLTAVASVAAVTIGAILFIITSLIVISLELILLSKLDLSSLLEEDKETHETKIASTMKAIVESLIVVSNEIWKAYSKGSGIVKTAIVALWLATNLLTIGALILVTGALWLFNKTASKLNEDEVHESTTKIVNLSRHLIDIALGGKGIYKEDENGRQQVNAEDESLINKLASVGGGILEVAKSLLAFANLATVALSVALLWGITAMLNKVAEFNLDENKVVAKVNQIIVCANSVSQAVFTGGSAEVKQEDSSVWNKAGQFLKGGIKAVGGAFGNIAAAGVLSTALVSVAEVESLATMLNKINDFNVNENDIVNKVNQIIRVSNLVAENVSTDNNMPWSIDKTKVKSYGVYVDNSIKLMKQINKLNTDKLIKYSDMWVKMSEFMEKMKNLNIEQLSDAIVNKIAPAMSDISGNVEKINSNSSKSSTPITANPASTVPNTPQPTDKQTKLPAEKPKDYTDILQSIKSLLEEYLES